LTTKIVKHDDDTYEIHQSLEKSHDPQIIRYRHSLNSQGEVVDFYDLEPKLQNKIINALSRGK